MPFINGKFYANPAYGRGVENARAADLVGHDGPGGEVELIAAQTHPQKMKQPPTPQRTAQKPSAAKSKPHGDGHDPATTTEGIGNQIYNETSGLRPTNKSGIGTGTDWDMQQARKAMAHVIRNRAAGKMVGGLGSDRIASGELKAIKSIASPAYDAHGGSQSAARDAARDAAELHDPTGGAELFFLDHGQPPPYWAKGKTPTAVFGPFKNEGGGGDVPKGASTRVKVYR